MALLYLLGLFFLVACQARPQTQLDDAATDQAQALAAFRAKLNQSVAKLWADVDYNNDSIFTVQDMLNILTGYDSNNDSSVSKQEFDTHFAQSGSGLSSVADELFKGLDMNHDGSVTASDLKLYYLRMDANNDGQVVKQEFEAYFSKLLIILLKIQLEKASTTVVPTTESPLLAKFKGIVDKEVQALWLLVDFNNDTEFDVKDMRTIFTDYDINSDGEISAAEFKNRFSTNVPSLQSVEIELFHELDMNHDGVIRQHDLDLYFQMIDRNDDGEVSEQEFTSYFTRIFTLLYAVALQTQGGIVG